MARIIFAGLWTIPNLQNRYARLLRGGADRIEIEILNLGLNGLTYTIEDDIRWQTRMDGIFGAVPIPDTGMLTALGALDFVPMHDNFYTNLGSRSGAATYIAGSLVNNNPIFNPESNATYEQLANGYIRLSAAGTFASYNGPFTVGMWIYPTLVSALAPLYQESNAAVTHFLQIFLDTDHRIGIRMNNGVTNFSVKDAGGPQIPLNQWSFIICKYATPNFTYTLAPNSNSTSVSVGAGGLTTFADANATYIGLISGMNGYFGMPFTFNNAIFNGQTTAPLSPAMQDYIYYEWQGASGGIALPLDTASLAGNGLFQGAYGKGTGRPLPSVLGILAASNGVGDTRAYVRFTLVKDE